uniref:Ribosome biogenesis protein NOP53 n=1 Tax=Zooxanthella nutricula TaxID=1333877 RepID=A0A7S2QKK9_9DINO
MAPVGPRRRAALQAFVSLALAIRCRALQMLSTPRPFPDVTFSGGSSPYLFMGDRVNGPVTEDPRPKTEADAFDFVRHASPRRAPERVVKIDKRARTVDTAPSEARKRWNVDMSSSMKPRPEVGKWKQKFIISDSTGLGQDMDRFKTQEDLDPSDKQEDSDLAGRQEKRKRSQRQEPGIAAPLEPKHHMGPIKEIAGLGDQRQWAAQTRAARVSHLRIDVNSQRSKPKKPPRSKPKELPLRTADKIHTMRKLAAHTEGTRAWKKQPEKMLLATSQALGGKPDAKRTDGRDRPRGTFDQAASVDFLIEPTRIEERRVNAPEMPTPVPKSQSLCGKLCKHAKFLVGWPARPAKIDVPAPKPERLHFVDDSSSEGW